MQITYYAGAADAAGTTDLLVDVGAVTSAELMRVLGADNPRLAAVLTRCSVLANGVSVGAEDLIDAQARVDVLPPFAGG